MKKLLCAIALGAAGLSACTGLSNATAVVAAATGSAPIGDKITMDERGLYAVEALYNVPANAYRNAVQAGAMTPALRASVRPKLLELQRIRNLARTAYNIGDRTSWDQRIAEIQKLKAQITALLPSSN